MMSGWGGRSNQHRARHTAYVGVLLQLVGWKGQPHSDGAHKCRICGVSATADHQLLSDEDPIMTVAYLVDNCHRHFFVDVGHFDGAGGVPGARNLSYLLPSHQVARHTVSVQPVGNLKTPSSNVTTRR